MNFAPLRTLFLERDYVTYIIGTAISLTGIWIQRITIAWLVWEMTKSPLWVGLTAAADLLPTLLGALYGGVLADRLNRLQFLFACQLVCALILCGLALAYQFDVLTLGLLIALRVSLSGAIALAHPTRMVLLVDLVGQRNLGAAVAFGSVVFNVARSVGPALAGGLIAFGGFSLALLVNALTFLAMAAAIMIIRHKGRTVSVARPAIRKHVVAEVIRACRYISRHDGFRPLFLLYILYVISARAIEDLLPAFVETLFAGGVEDVAILISMLGVGSVIGGVWASARPVSGLTRSMLMAGIAQTLCVAALAVAGSFKVACALTLTIGFFTVQFGTAAQTLVQFSVEDGLRGRVMSLWYIILRGGPGVGALILGAAAEVLGLSGAFLLGAAAGLAACGFAWRHRQRWAGRLEVTRDAVS